MMSDVEKKQTVNSFIENIAGMSDKGYQERVWVRGEGSECDDIDDTICDFFDEDYIIEKYQDFGITDKQYEALIKLRDKLRKFTDTYKVYFPEKSTEKLINIPEWKKIMSLANEVLKAFGYQKKST